jgi:hypothetical protein
VTFNKIAVISQSTNVDFGFAARAAAAVQQQVANEFATAWQVSATVAAFPTLQDMPDGFSPVVVRDVLPISALGAHVSEAGDQAFALVAFSGSRWTVTLSHEVLELIMDPLGTAWFDGPSPQRTDLSVRFLAEVCDPCQGDGCAYSGAGGVLVSDFVTPKYYTAFGPGSYTFRGNIGRPRTVAAGGYLTWRDPLDGTWGQLFDDGAGPAFRTPTPDELRPDLHLRGEVDRDAETARARRRRGRRPTAARVEARVRRQEARAAAVRAARATWWEAQFERALARAGAR